MPIEMRSEEGNGVDRPTMGSEEEEWTPGWKVVDEEGGSVYAPWYARRVYPKGVVVAPKKGCGWLAYFSRRGAAERWAGMVSGPVIIVAVAVLPKAMREGERLFWWEGDRSPMLWGEAALPAGTRAARKVCRLEEMDWVPKEEEE